MINRYAICVLLFFGLNVDVHSCEIKINNEFAVHGEINANNSVIYFYKSNQGKDDPEDPYSSKINEYTVDAHQYSCETKIDRIIETYPYMAAPPIIKSVFFEDANSDGVKEVFVLVSWDVKTDPVEGNVGSLYGVFSYKYHKDGYLVKDEEISNYFGMGIDKKIEDKLIEFAYKKASDVKKEIKSERYKKWLKNEKQH